MFELSVSVILLLFCKVWLQGWSNGVPLVRSRSTALARKCCRRTFIHVGKADRTHACIVFILEAIFHHRSSCSQQY